MRVKKIIIGLLTTLVILALIAGVLLLFIRYYYRPILENVLGQALGAKVKIAGVRLNVKKHTLLISGFKLYNPEEFGKDKLLADLPQINATFDFKNIATTKKLHLTKLEMYVKILVVIKDKKGELNVEKLALFKENSQEIPLQLDQLVLTADIIIFKDASKEEHLHIESFNINIKNQVYQGVPTVEDITATVISEMIKRTTIKGAKMLGNAVVIGAVGGWSLLLAGETINVVTNKAGYDITLDVTYEDAYKASLEVAKELGKDIRQRQSEGIISGCIDDADVVIKISKELDDRTSISVSAKKYFFPKPNIAGGISYEITERLGKI